MTCAIHAESVESRLVLSRLTAGPSIDVSLLAGNQDESAIVVNPNDSNQLFVMSNHEAGGLFAARSIDGGATWLTSNGNDAIIADGNDNLIAACCDPTVAWDTFGNLFISYVDANLQEVPIAISTDGGATFAPLTSITGGFADQPTITTGPDQGGTGQSLWITYDKGGIQAHGASITGLGATNVGAFSAPQAVTGIGQFGDIAVGPNGQVTVAGQSDTEIQVATDPDGLGAQGFTAAVTATATNVDTFDAIPAQDRRTIDAESGLAYDRSGGVNDGRLYLVYTDETIDENDDTDVFVRISSDDGATWGPRIRVNDDGTTNSQFLNKIAVDQTTGNIGVAWYDARNSTNNTTFQVFATVSTDGGLTWDVNTQISDGTSDASVAATGAQQLGDYIGLTFNAGKLHPSWADNSNSDGNNPDGTLAELDIYTATVAVAPPPLVLTLSTNTIREDADGTTPGSGGVRGTVRRPAGMPTTASLVVTLTSDDTTEITVPASVTIPIGAFSRTFNVTVVDDTILDGPQFVTITADATDAGNPLTATASITVEDYETISLTIDKSSIKENAGPDAATVTVTRSNTDTFPPNPYIVANNRLKEYDYQGNLVSNRVIPWPQGFRPASQQAHDLVTLQNGRIAVYNGTTLGYVSIFNPSTTTWQHFFIPGLSTSADVATGGITSWGNYVFVSDMSSTPTDPFGVVRLDLTTGQQTRFATKSPGYRLFVKDVFSDNIDEIDPLTGITINSIPMPVTNTFGFNTGMAFDGTYLWVLAGDIGNDTIYQLNPDTGVVVDIHNLGGNNGWDGLACLNGLIYAQDDFIDNKISVYDPAQKRVIKTLNVDKNISGGLTGITGPDALIGTSTFVNPSTGNFDLYEIDPNTGSVKVSWDSGMSTPPDGVGAADNQIYVGEFNNSFGAGLRNTNLRIFNRDGSFNRVVPVTVTGPAGIFAIGGDDIKGLATTTYRYRDLYAGLDDQLYVLDTAGTSVGRFDPETMVLDQFFDVPATINALAIDSRGFIWGAGRDGTLYKFSNSGSLLDSQGIGSAELIDIDVNITGQILLTDRDGAVHQTNVAMPTATTFDTGAAPAFITLGRNQIFPAGDAIVQLTNGDPTEISIPSQVIIPIGQQSVTFPLDAVDDAILDGPQTATITAIALGYPEPASASITVLDVEDIGIDIIATDINEADGKAATRARVFRTDVDGPFPYISTKKYINSSSQTILDSDKTTSHLAVASQMSRIEHITATITLTHQNLADLDIFLISPSGTRIELVTDLVSNEPYLTNTKFDSYARQSILKGSSPFTGSFLPEGDLDDLIGENPSGDWRLEITDDNQRNFGTLLNWSLSIETAGLAPLVVDLSLTGDPGEINVQNTVTIPANQAEIYIPVDALDDTLLDGTRIAGVQASANALGYVFAGDSVNVHDQETFTFTVSKSSVSEAADNPALKGTLTRNNSDIGLQYIVQVTTSDPSELSLGATTTRAITIPAGKSSVTFNINAVDDNIIDGSQTVTLTASAVDYTPSTLTQTVVVTDLEPGLVLTTNTPTVRENSGSFVLNVKRVDQADISQPMTVNLSTVNVPNRRKPTLSVPASITIPANKLSTNVTVTVLDDKLLDGTQVARIDATSTGAVPGTIQIRVTDHETLSVNISTSEFLENAGATAATGTVTRSNTNRANPLVVYLSSSDNSELTVPSTVTIPAGAASVTFDIAAVNDPVLDGSQVVSIRASATGYVAGSASVTVADHEPPVITAPGSTTAAAKPIIRWKAIPGALRYELLLSNLSAGVNQLIYRTDLTTISFQPQEKLGIGRYRVWVRAVDSLERPGFWSLPRDFKVVTAPSITRPRISGTQAPAVFPEIAWTAVADATRYELWVNNLTTGETRVISRQDLTTTSYRSTEDLVSGSYRAWVRAFNSSDEFGSWSSPKNFTVLATPTVIQPTAGGTFDRTPLITWNAITGANNYDVWLSSRSTNSVILRNKYVTGTSLQVSSDLANGDYTVWVRAQNGAYYSAWSPARLFSVGIPPKILSPNNNSRPGGKPKFTWTSISDTERYELWVTNLTTNTVAINLTNLTDTSFTPTTALSKGNYRVWVRAVSTMGETTDWSVGVSFTVAWTSDPADNDATNEDLRVASALPKQLAEPAVRGPGVAVQVAWEQQDSAEPTGVESASLPEPSASGATQARLISEDGREFDAVMAGWHESDWWNANAALLENVPVGQPTILRRNTGREDSAIPESV